MSLEQLEKPKDKGRIANSLMQSAKIDIWTWSRFLTATALFFVLNWLILPMASIRFDPYSYPCIGWTAWLIKDLKESKEQFNLALFGSSLMMSAITSCDSEYLQRPLAANNHRTADYLEHKLSGQFKGSFKTFNFATPGQMPSDACLFLRMLLSLGHRPDTIIYGIAPRDFIDSTLAEPIETEPFPYLNRLVKTDDLADHLYDSWPSRLNLLLERSLFLSHYAIDLGMKANHAADHLLSFLVPAPSGQNPFTCWNRMKLLPSYKPTENSAYAFREVHGSVKEQGGWSADNTQDYVQRYRYRNEHGFKSQCYFLKSMETTCSQHRIRLILVNMPLTQANVALLGKKRYDEYLRNIASVAASNHIQLYDFNDAQQYPDHLFKDPVHLNAAGGRKMLDQLACQLDRDDSVKQELVASGMRLKQQQQLALTNKGSI